MLNFMQTKLEIKEEQIFINKAVTIEFQRRRLYNIYNKNKAGEQTDNV